MCVKRVVNREDRRGGKEQQAPVGLIVSLPALMWGDQMFAR